MTFNESKISAEKAAETGVQSQPDALTGSAEGKQEGFRSAAAAYYREA